MFLGTEEIHAPRDASGAYSTFMRETRFGFDRSGVGHVEGPHGGSYCVALQRRWKSDHIGFLRRYREHLGYKNFCVSLPFLSFVLEDKFQYRICEFIRYAQVNRGSIHYFHFVHFRYQICLLLSDRGGAIVSRYFISIAPLFFLIFYLSNITVEYQRTF